MKKRLSSIILIFILLTGLSLLLYPAFSDWWNSLFQSRAIEEYVDAVNGMDPEVSAAMLEEAREYNIRFRAKGNLAQLTDEELKDYHNILNLTGTGIMGYLEIPSIHVSLPIYHGTDEATLQVAVGHLEGTSLPVGGKDTHAVLSGHRGLPSAKLLSNLDQMVEGDLFSVRVLGEELTYIVDQIRIVLPEEVGELAIEKGEDYVTLVTCTPYGINTHRLLVRGRRVELEERADLVVADAVMIPPVKVAAAIAAPIVALYLLFMLLPSPRGRGRKHSK